MTTVTVAEHARRGLINVCVCVCVCVCIDLRKVFDLWCICGSVPRTVQYRAAYHTIICVFVRMRKKFEHASLYGAMARPRSDREKY